MNIILFYPSEVQHPLPRHDPRAKHILNVLRRGKGGVIDVGLINGLRGKATLNSLTDEALFLSYAWQEMPSPLAPIRLIVGLPRPQTARDILRESASLGVAALDFVLTEKTESSYTQSSLWTTNEWERLLVTGAAQAFCTRLPAVQHGQSLSQCLAELPVDSIKIALDNYESPVPLSNLTLPNHSSVIIALGGERGWTSVDRDQLRAHDFSFAHLGERVLRTETACISAVTLIKAKLGLL